jgi:prolyl-tRNA synthetase
VEKAQFVKLKDESTGALLPLEEIFTPGIKTIEELARFVGVPKSKTLKAVFYSADGNLVFVLIRGDLEVNETKLKNALKCSELRLAAETEVSELGLVPGFASPIGLKGMKVVADDSILLGENFIVGANKRGYHLKNANYPRDFQVDIIADIALARANYRCAKCNSSLSAARAIEVGHIFKLGTFLSEKFGASFLDPEGRSHPLVMGCYGIGLGRLLAAVVELNHDEKGIIWPFAVAPYHVYLCPLYLDRSDVAATAERIYQELQQQNVEVLFDDRDESPGVKFNDADLLGIPLRLTLSPRTLQREAVEAKWRTEKEPLLLPLGNLAARVAQILTQASKSPPQVTSQR